jgi:bacterioferritin
MASERLKEILNQSIARELAVSIQYMWQHVQVKGLAGQTVEDEIRNISIQEMKHAEAFAERLNYLGGIPTTLPETITVGESVQEMLRIDKKSEEDAIKLYKAGIELAEQEHDPTTRLLFENILKAEEEHHDFFSKVLEE